MLTMCFPLAVPGFGEVDKRAWPRWPGSRPASRGYWSR